jgi:hypothetical protein
MTMQVGMVGTDGIVLASDTRYISQGAGVRQSFNASKITANYDRGIAISQAHCMETARRIGDAILSDLKDSEFGSPTGPIERIASTVIDPAGSRKQVECLIALVKPTPRLFYLQSGMVDFGVRCDQICGAVNVGDKENAAIFWRQRYYQKSPIRGLIALAAHLVCVSRHLNSGSIGGLEIVLCDAAGLRRLSDKDIIRLEKKADEWDGKMGGLLKNHRQRFAFDPKVVG